MVQFTPYNDPITNTSSLQAALVNINHELTRGLLGLTILVVLWIILFIRLQRYHDTKEAFTTSSFLCLVVGLMLWLIGIAQFYVLIFFFLVTLISMGAMYWQNS